MLIDTRLAERLKKVNPSSTLALTAKAKKLKAEGRDIVTLAAGEPDFDTPEFIKDAAIEALKSGFTKYTPTAGTVELRKSIADKFKRDNSLSYSPEQIIVSCGAKHSIFNALMCLVNKGDEVIIPSPYWVSYPEMVRLCEGIPRFIKTSAKNQFKISPKDLETHITKKTKVAIINTPSNPTGCVYSRQELQDIAGVCVKKKVFVISDEIYEKIIFDGLKHISIASLGKEIFDLTVTVNGLSKSYSMTGWRIGYLGAPTYIAETISRLQDHSTSNPTSIAQKAALAALNSNGDFPKMMCSEFQKRRDFLVQRLSKIKKISLVVPQGAFYLFCDIARTGLDSNALAIRLLEEAGIAVIPGIAFGRDDSIRLSFAASQENLKIACERLDKWISQL